MALKNKPRIKDQGSRILKVVLPFLLLASLLFILSGCKVSYGLKGITIPPEAKSISVVMFQNQTDLTAPLEPQLITQRLRDAVSSQTNLTLLRQGGDLVFEDCRIIGYSVAPQSIAASNGTSIDQAALNRLTVTISVTYTCKFDETKNFKDKTFSRYYDFSATQSLSQAESAALDQINRQLVEDIFNAAFNNW